MKKTYLQPETESLEIRDHQPLMSNTVTLPVGDGGNNETPKPKDDVSEFEDLLAKPGIIYDAWEDEDKEIDFHTDV
jgi:hypothetical protein